MPIIATWTRGSVVVSRPLPSLVQMQMLPVSATAKLTPLMPRSASRNAPRSTRAGELRHVRHVGDVVVGRAELLAEDPRDVLLRLVEDWGDDVRRAVVVELHDELAEVGLDHLDAGGLECVVELDLLADHRLRLDREPAGRVPAPRSRT